MEEFEIYNHNKNNFLENEWDEYNQLVDNATSYFIVNALYEEIDGKSTVAYPHNTSLNEDIT